MTLIFCIFLRTLFQNKIWPTLTNHTLNYNPFVLIISGIHTLWSQLSIQSNDFKKYKNNHNYKTQWAPPIRICFHMISVDLCLTTNLSNLSKPRSILGLVFRSIQVKISVGIKVTSFLIIYQILWSDHTKNLYTTYILTNRLCCWQYHWRTVGWVRILKINTFLSVKL